MKTVGLLALMHQSGLQIPADEGSTLRIFDGVYADVGDQQSIEESVSTFSSHIKNVIDILDVATPSSLVLMDELGTSTDPEEGSAIAKAILQDLAEHGVTAIATTHYRNVAAFAEASQGMSNASVQLDSETLQPTYTVTMGIPGRSYAMNVASSLGLRQDILENARALMEPQYLRFEDWLTELQKDRDQLQNRIVETEAERTALAAQKAALDEQMQYLARHREDILDSVRRAAIDQYEDVRRKLRRAEAAMSWVPEGASGERPRFDVSTARREIEAQRQQISAVPVSIVRAEPRPLAVGDQVQVRGLQLRGEIIALPVQGTEVEVNVGRVNLKVDISRLHRVDEDPEALPEQPNVKIDLGPILDTMELDLRGQRVEEALSRLEEFLDKAMRDGLRSVRIIHGRGTGALRNAVREHMRRHPYVRSFEPEVRERGGDGATLAQLD
jgi:DNA mismatch repair protein MutS2